MAMKIGVKSMKKRSFNKRCMEVIEENMRIRLPQELVKKRPKRRRGCMKRLIPASRKKHVAPLT